MDVVSLPAPCTAESDLLASYGMVTRFNHPISSLSVVCSNIGGFHVPVPSMSTTCEEGASPLSEPHLEHADSPNGPTVTVGLIVLSSLVLGETPLLFADSVT